MRSTKRFDAKFGILLILSSALLASGKNERDFAGSYRIEGATDQDGTVRITLAVRVFNYSDANVSEATITLEDSLPPHKAYGSFKNVSIPDRESIALTGDFAVPRREYERWEKGATPDLSIEFRDTDGNSVRRMVELMRAAAAEE